MENASKALLIAGAILIVILLIAVGMMVYQGAQGSINRAIGSMSSTEKDIHNKQFEAYLGSNISGSRVRDLISKVISNNGGDDNVEVSINYSNAASAAAAAVTGELSNIMSNVTTSARASYTVNAQYNDGVITEITIQRN